MMTDIIYYTYTNAPVGYNGLTPSYQGSILDVHFYPFYAFP